MSVVQKWRGGDDGPGIRFLIKLYNTHATPMLPAANRWNESYFITRRKHLG